MMEYFEYDKPTAEELEDMLFDLAGIMYDFLCEMEVGNERGMQAEFEKADEIWRIPWKYRRFSGMMEDPETVSEKDWKEFKAFAGFTR